MNYKQEIFSYENPGKHNRVKYILSKTGVSRSGENKYFLKKYPHSSFSCYERLHDFQNKINEIIRKCELKPDNSYHYKDKKSTFKYN